MREIASPAGLRLLGNLIHLMENKSEIKKVLAEINGARDEANTAIRVVGKIKDIDALKDEAAVALGKADAALADAKVEADKILKKAGVKALSEKKRQEVAAEVLRKNTDWEATLEARETSVTAREKEIKVQIGAASSMREEAIELNARGEKLTKEADIRLARFERFASQLQ